RADPEARQVAARRGARVLQLPRSPWQHGGSGSIPHGGRAKLAARSAKTESASPDEVGALPTARRSLDTPPQGPAPLPERPLPRQTPELTGYPVIFPAGFGYLKGAGFLDSSGLNNLSMR